MSTNKELQDNELKTVSGGANNNGSISINRNDYCKHSPSHFSEYTGQFSLPSDMHQCKICAYNPHRDWENSTCDYPNRH